MSIAMHELTQPPFAQILAALSGVLAKAEAHAALKKFDAGVLLGARLAPDMFPLSRQVEIACDLAASSLARLTGVEVPSWRAEAKTIADVRAHIAKTLDYLGAFKPGDIDGTEGREITLSLAGKPVTMAAKPYLFQFVLPNFYFHAAIAYAILRHNGVDLGKRDFLGEVPGL